MMALFATRIVGAAPTRTPGGFIGCCAFSVTAASSHATDRIDSVGWTRGNKGVAGWSGAGADARDRVPDVRTCGGDLRAPAACRTLIRRTAPWSRLSVSASPADLEETHVHRPPFRRAARRRSGLARRDARPDRGHREFRSWPYRARRPQWLRQVDPAAPDRRR